MTGFFANPAGPTGAQHAALGGQGISIVSYSQNQEEAFKFLEWFIQDETCRRSGPSSAATPATPAVLESPEFHNATPYNEAFYQTMFRCEGLLGGAGVRRLAVPDEPPHLPLRRRRQGTAKEALDALAADWDATFKKYKRQ